MTREDQNLMVAFHANKWL